MVTAGGKVEMLSGIPAHCRSEIIAVNSSKVQSKRFMQKWMSEREGRYFWVGKGNDCVQNGRQNMSLKSYLRVDDFYYLVI